jgi:hypothetical protein
MKAFWSRIPRELSLYVPGEQQAREPSHVFQVGELAAIEPVDVGLPPLQLGLASEKWRVPL